MSDLEQFILKHGSVPMDQVKDVVHYVDGYNPAQAREYYLRTRKLKGRQKGSSVGPTGKRPTGKVAPTGFRTAQKKPPASRKEVEARVNEMKGRLLKLRKLLKQLVDQAQARSGIDPKDEKAKATAGKKLTAAERKKAAEASAKYRKANPEKDESLSDQEKRLAEQIKDVNAKISKARADLKSAVAKARTGSANTTRQR